MKYYEKLFAVLILLIAVNVNAQWVLQPVGTTYSLNNIHFVNSNTGYIAGNLGTILKTTNGGTNWVNKSTLLDLDVNNIFFLNADTGFAVCCNSPLITSRILKTTNGGVNWVSKFYNTRIRLSPAIHFINSNTGFAGGWSIGLDSAVYKTTNGGENWITANVSGVTGVDEFSFIDSNTGWAVGAGNHYSDVIKTTNGGTNWNIIYGDYTNPSFVSIYFVNANTGWIVGISLNNTSLIRKTTDGGFNWVEQVNQHPANWELYNIYMLNANTGWIVGDAGQIVKTTNSGTNWRSQNNSGGSWFAVEFIGPDTGWVAGVGGQLLKTVNGGGPVSVNNISSEIPLSFSLSQNYPNPFNQSSIIKFQCAIAGNVKVVIYDVTGREVNTLVNQWLQPGTYAVSFIGSELSSGVYYYRIISGNYMETKKMLMIK
jgi:photosystem II stability/assembly factor-like uncharacterized protein